MSATTFYILGISILIGYAYCLNTVAKGLWDHKIDGEFIFCASMIALQFGNEILKLFSA